MPLISVILPAYNVENYIEAAIESILNQTLIDFEFIIINDCSTDRTGEIIQSYSDERIVYIENKTNQKVVRCLNAGLAKAKGQFIARMDGDDISYPHRFQSQIYYLNTHPGVDICGSWVRVFGEKSHVHFLSESHEAIKASLVFQNSIIHPSVMFRKEKFLASGYQYDESFTNAEDYGLWANMLDHFKFAVIPEILLDYRIHDNNVSVHKEENWAVLKAMNYKVYKIMLKKIGVIYTSEDLATHIHIGFRMEERLSHKQFITYLSWLRKIVTANNHSKYIDLQSLYNEVVEHIILLSRKLRKSPAVLFQIVKTIASISSVKLGVGYVPFKLNKSSNYKRNQAAINH